MERGRKRGTTAARCVAFLCVLLLCGGGSFTASAAPTVLLGDQTIEPGSDSDAAGQAEAFRTTATSSGQVAALNVYVASTSAATKLVAGLYASSGTHPGALLAQGSLVAPAKGAWDTVTLTSSAAVTSGTTYWIAILSPSGAGAIGFRDLLNGTGASETSSQTTLAALASTWSTGAAYRDGPLSAYGVSGQIAPDTQPPTVPTGLVVGGITQTSMSLSWTASTDNVAVAGYDVFLDGVSKGTTTSTSFGFTGLGCGTTHTLAVDAFDAAGNKSTQASIQATTSACPDTAPPSVPTGLTVVSATSTSIAVSWTASTDNVGVAGYGLYVGGTSVGSTTATSNTFTALGCASTYVLGVDAYDAAGNRSAKATISAATAACDTTPPSVQLTAPADGSTATGTIPVSANAADDVAVAGVQFQLDGVNLGSEVTSSPYTLNWDTRAAANGMHTLTAVARDSSNNKTTSAPVTVTVSNDHTPPTVSVTAPVLGATVSGKSVAVTAQASDNVAVAGVQFQLDGANLGAEVTATPYSITWDSTAASDGQHTLTAVARDTSNNTASAAVTVTVANGTVDTSNTFVPVNVGPGIVEHTVHGVVRTAGNRVYVFVADDTPERTSSGPGVIRAYRANTTRNPLGFTEADTANHPSSTGLHVLFGPDVRLDRSGLAHLVYVDQADTHLYYQTFSTVTDRWGPRQLLSASTPVNDGFYGGATRVYRSYTSYDLALDNNDVPHVIYSSGNTVYYVNKVGGTWSAPQAIYTGTSPIHEALAADASFNLYAAWLNDPASQNQQTPQYCGSSIVYARRDAVTGTWSTPETVDTGCPNVLSGQTGDQGPTIVLDASNEPEVQYLSGTINSIGQAVTTATIKRRTGSGWVDDTPPSSGYSVTHADQLYSQGNDLYLMLGHDVNLHFGDLFQLSGQPWSAFNVLDTASKDGSASVRWDPQRETNAHIIDVAYHDEDRNHNATYLAQTYYMAILPARDMPQPDTVPPTVSMTAPAGGATVSGTNVTVSASASDNVGVAGVQFSLDGVNLGLEVTAPLYTITWDTTTATNGSHTLSAVARDAAGNTATSSESVSVNNPTPPPPPPPPPGTIAFVKQLGTNSQANSGGAVTLTVPSGGVAAGDTVIIWAGMSGSGTRVSSISDSRGNSYSVDSTINNTSFSFNTFIGSGYATTALLPGDTITVTFSASYYSLRAVAAAEFSGIPASGRLDQRAAATGNSAAPASGATATTAQAAELVVGGFGSNGTATFTPAAGFTALTSVRASLGSVNLSLYEEYELVQTQGAYQASGTLSAAGPWNAAVATYR